MKIIPLVLAFLVPASVTAGPSYTGNDFLRYCSQSPQVVYGFVLGWSVRRSADLEIGAKAIASTSGAAKDVAIRMSTTMMFSTCTPNEVTVEQMADVLCKFLSDNPSVRHQGAGALMSFAMVSAFPCVD